MKIFIRNLKGLLILFIVISVTLLIGLFIQQERSKNELSVAAGENKESLKTRYAKAGSILDRNMILLAGNKDGSRIYCEDPSIAASMLQLVGDYTHNMENTIEARYQNVLLGTDRDLFSQLLLDVQGKGLSGDDIILTADANLSKKATALLGERKGAIVILNYKTGEILTAVSTPTTNPESVVNFENIPDSALFNRAFSGKYAPGSTFKLITATAFLTAPDFNPDFNVDCQPNSAVYNEFGASESGSSHGYLTLDSAFAHSCNIFFGQAGVNAGSKHLIDTAESMGYNMPISLDLLRIQQSEIKTADDPVTVSWLSIGQPSAESILYMTPLQMAMLAGAIGNDGSMLEPHIIHHFSTPAEKKYGDFTVKTAKQILNGEQAARIEELMLGVTRNGTGTAAAVPGYNVASKTGTVQVEGKENTALTIAYITEENMPYSIAVVVEEGGSGGGTAAGIAGQLLNEAVLLAG